MILHENRLPADDSHEISCLICYFGKSSKIINCRLLQIIGGPLRAKPNFVFVSLAGATEASMLISHLCLVCVGTISLLGGGGGEGGGGG